MGQPRLLLVAALIAAVALLISLSFAGVTLTERQHAVDVTCKQVKKLRTDLVAVLQAAREASKQNTASLTPEQAARLRARIDAFYAPQLARVRPIRCP